MGSTILVVDDITLSRLHLKAQLAAASYHPLLASCGEEALRLARQHQPALILLDLGVKDMDGMHLLAQLQADPRTRMIPVLALCRSGQLEDRLKALHLGAEDVFSPPYSDALLLARLRNLLRATQDWSMMQDEEAELLLGLNESSVDFRVPATIALLTDRSQTALHLRRNLAPYMQDKILPLAHMEALIDPHINETRADLYLIDTSSLGAETTLRLISDLRSRSASCQASICLFSAECSDGPYAQIALDLGVNALISQAMPAAEIARRLQSALRRKRQADQRRERMQDGLRLAMYDPLTGLHNRRYASARLRELALQNAQNPQGLAIMIADIDRFKRVNDIYGHAVGDQVLREVAHRLTAHLRQGDLLARVGAKSL